MKYFHGSNRRSRYFEGWYLKHQAKSGAALALIPAFHIDDNGRRSASLQVVTDSGAWWLEYPDIKFQAAEKQFQIRMGACRFHKEGIFVEIEEDGLSLHGKVHYGAFTPLRSDIMGPFRFFAGMECAHGLISMGHTLKGQLMLNGESMDFSGGRGYIETDRGRSFPSAYLWTQCSWAEHSYSSLMLSIATIPLPVGGFTGCICAVFHQGREYRLATYRGAEIEHWSSRGVAVRQGKYRLEVELLSENRRPLRAPVSGDMNRMIHESLCATVRYRFSYGEQLLFEHMDPYASFEFSEEMKRI